MRLVLIGDVHIFRLALPPASLLSKRILGQTNLWLNRRHRFEHALMKCILDRIVSLDPNMLLLTGDLTTTALEQEFQDIGRLLEPLTGRFHTIAVPGNHDRYTFTSARVGRMERMLPGLVPPRFPDFRKLTDHWSLLALDGAVPRLLNARGRLGARQLHRAHRHVRRLSADEGLIVLCHYPLKTPPRVPPATWDHKLAESGRLRRILRHCPARILYVHGHIHRPWCWQPRRPRHGRITYINAGSPCLTSTRHPQGQGFWQIDLPEDPNDPIGFVHHVPMSDGIGGRSGGVNDVRITDWEAREGF